MFGWSDDRDHRCWESWVSGFGDPGLCNIIFLGLYDAIILISQSHEVSWILGLCVAMVIMYHVVREVLCRSKSV